MKKLFLVVLALLMANMCYAGQGTIQEVFTSDSVETTNTVTSRVFPVKSLGYFGVWAKQTAALGTPNVDVTYEMSYDTTASNFTVPVDKDPIFDNWTAQVASVTSITPSPMKYIRFKATGNSANTTGTTITMYLFTQD